MGHSHAHGHQHLGAQADSGRLKLALGLIVGLMAVEIVAGILAGSLALLSDAGHMLTDAGALALALVAARLARRPAGGNFTFGLRRAEILSAQINGATLVALGAVIVFEGVRRLISPPEVEGLPVLVVALVGVAVNLVATRVLAGADRSSLNVEGAFQHVLTDLFAFIATAAAGVVVLATGFTEADGIAALLVAALMLRAGFGLLRDSGRVLLEAAPRGLDPERGGAGPGRAAPRGRGARPAPLGGQLGLPGPLRSRAGAQGLRRPGPPPPAGPAPARALRHRAQHPAGGAGGRRGRAAGDRAARAGRRALTWRRAS